MLFDGFAIFLCFCCLQVMEFRLLFFMECQCLDHKFVVERCFLDFFWLCDEDNVELLNGGWGAWWWRRIKTEQG